MRVYKLENGERFATNSGIYEVVAIRPDHNAICDVVEIVFSDDQDDGHASDVVITWTKNDLKHAIRDDRADGKIFDYFEIGDDLI